MVSGKRRRGSKGEVAPKEAEKMSSKHVKSGSIFTPAKKVVAVPAKDKIAKIKEAALSEAEKRLASAEKKNKEREERLAKRVRLGRYGFGSSRRGNERRSIRKRRRINYDDIKL